MNRKIDLIKELKVGGQKSVSLVKCGDQEMICKVGKCNSKNSLIRIKREVDILKGIDSDFFPKNYDFSYDESKGTFQILEEYIKGNTLWECMDNYNSEIEITQLILDIIKGMQLLWKKEIVHRDLKPENIIISEKRKKPVIIDLGIAKDLLDVSLTKTIMPMGPCTIPYASPEQLLNQKNLISPRSDFFSLGIIAMELYYKKNPFLPEWVGSGLSIKENIISGNLKTPIKENERSEAFIKIFSKALEKEPFNRYRRYVDFENELKTFLIEGV